VTKEDNEYMRVRGLVGLGSYNPNIFTNKSQNSNFGNKNKELDNCNSDTGLQTSTVKGKRENGKGYLDLMALDKP
jgi:hypothetical protein